MRKMKDRSILCNIGHFDNEIQVSALKNYKWNEVKPQVHEIEFPDKKRIILSPDYVMLNKKGSIYEHNIYFACLLLNYYSTLYSNNDKIKYKKILENKAEELAKKQSNNLDLIFSSNRHSQRN